MRRILFAAALLTLVAPPPKAEAQNRRDEYESRLDTTFAFDRRGSVLLSISSGEIVVTGWNRDQIRVRAHSERGAIRMDAGAARLSLDLTRQRGGDTRFEITVPHGVRVSARASGGDISIRGTKGSIEARTNSGDLTVEDAAERIDLNSYSGDIVARELNGSVEITSLSGEVRLTQARGDVDVTTVSGDIEMRDITSRFVRAKSTSGEIAFDSPVDGSGRYELGSHSGGVYLTVPQNTGALLTIATYSGSIESDFPITLKPGEHAVGASKRFTFEIGKGDARISAESFSGDIIIRSRDRRAGQ